MHFNDQERRIVRFFRSKFILWATGMLDQETERQLDNLTPQGHENWKQVTERLIGWDAAMIRTVHTILQDARGLSEADAALCVMDLLIEPEAVGANN